MCFFRYSCMNRNSYDVSQQRKCRRRPPDSAFGSGCVTIDKAKSTTVNSRPVEAKRPNNKRLVNNRLVSKTNMANGEKNSQNNPKLVNGMKSRPTIQNGQKKIIPETEKSSTAMKKSTSTPTFRSKPVRSNSSVKINGVPINAINRPKSQTDAQKSLNKVNATAKAAAAFREQRQPGATRSTRTALLRATAIKAAQAQNGGTKTSNIEQPTPTKTTSQTPKNPKPELIKQVLIEKNKKKESHQMPKPQFKVGGSVSQSKSLGVIHENQTEEIEPELYRFDEEDTKEIRICITRVLRLLEMRIFIEGRLVRRLLTRDDDDTFRMPDSRSTSVRKKMSSLNFH